MRNLIATLVCAAAAATDVLNASTNPYLHALDDLSLESPVTAFFKFCREREAIRMRRESGAPPPWSEDIVFQRARFLNVFREDDRSTKSILSFVARTLPSGADLDENLLTLLQALFFARWCNRDSTLDGIASPAAFLSSEASVARTTLERVSSPPWDNVAAYPVGQVRWHGTSFSRLEAATELFADRTCLEFLARTIRGAHGSVLEATAAINDVFAMENDFPIFMAVMDVAWFRPDLIDPGSDVPVGIGAIPFLRLLGRELGEELNHTQIFWRMIELQPTLWPEAKRALQPIDVEYLCCECRKYYSYVVGSKGFEGKNLFVPGQSPMMTFEIPTSADEIASEASGHVPPVYVIAGAPGCGKSSLVAALRGRGLRVEAETAETMIQAGLAAGHTAAQLRSDPVAWQLTLLEKDYELFEGLFGHNGSDAATSGTRAAPVFTDTSFVETAVFSRRAGVALGPNAEAWLRAPARRYRAVFFLTPLRTYSETDVRVESRQMADLISEEVRAAYERLGYELVIVPPLSIEGRVDFVRSHVEGAARADDREL